MKSIKSMLFGIALIIFGCLVPFTVITATDAVGLIGVMVAFIGLIVAALALGAPVEKPEKSEKPKATEEVENKGE